MKRLTLVVLLITLLLGPAQVFAQGGATPADLQAQAQAAAQAAAQAQAQADQAQAQANALRGQANAQQARAAQLQAEAVQLGANQAAIGKAAEAQAAASQAEALFGQATALTIQAGRFEQVAKQQWIVAFASTSQAITSAVHLAQVALLNTTQQSLNAAQANGMVLGQRDTITTLTNQVDSLYRYLLGMGLLSLALVALIVLFLVRSRARDLNQFAAILAGTAKDKATVIVQDDTARTFRILQNNAEREYANGTSTSA